MPKLSTILSLVILAAFAQSAQAQSVPVTSAKTLSGLYACEAISAPTEQLACFKRETALLRTGETAGEFVTIDKEAAKEIEKDSFGFNLPKLNIFKSKGGDKKSDAPKQHAFAIKRTSKTARGYVRFYLENGQVWEQTQAGHVGRTGKKDPDMLIIKNAAFGSFRARLNEKGPLVRVKRIQ